MADLIDSYPTSEYNEPNGFSSSQTKIGQTCTGDGKKIGYCQFLLNNLGGGSGDCVVKVYAHTGTWGSSGVPTGAALATSDTVAYADIPSPMALVTFTFSGANQINLTNGTHYCLVMEPDSGWNNVVQNGFDYASASADGNMVQYLSGSWSASVYDTIFYLYAIESEFNLQLNIGDTWKAVEGMQINIGDAWKTVEGLQINIGDSWKTI